MEEEDLQFILLIPSSVNITSKEQLTKAIKEICLDNKNKFNVLFERLIDNKDARTTLSEYFDIECHLSDNLLSGYIDGVFGSYFYAGCKDMDSSDSHIFEPLEFSIVSNEIIFDLELPNEWIPNSDIY